MNRKNAALKYRDFALEVKGTTDAGTFSGYGSVFGVVDSYNEIVAPGAFSESLSAIKDKGRPVPVLWQHRSGEPIGIYESLTEDDVGLAVEGKLAVGKVARADEAHALMQMGAVSGLSIGYFVREDSFDQKTKVRTLKKLDLVEVSLVTFPANEDARVDTIKSKLAHGQLPTIREFEQLLREQGFSKHQAGVLATRGLKHLLDRGDLGSDGTGDALKSALAGFSIPN